MADHPITPQRKDMAPLFDEHPLLATLATLPPAPWATALEVHEPLPITLLDLGPLAAPLPPPQLTTILSATEQAHYHAFRHPKRKQEWLGGRIAAKAAVAILLASGGATPALATLVIGAEASGKPRLAVPDIPRTVHLSISHSHDQAAAMASFQPCGIDLQLVTPAVVRVRERFATPAEEALLAAGLANQSAMLRLTMLWAAKEALRKLVPLSPLLAFHDAVLTGVHRTDHAHLLLFSGDKICHNASRRLRVVAIFVGEYALAAAVLPTTE